MPDPFAQYAVPDDPFAAFAAQQPPEASGVQRFLSGAANDPLADNPVTAGELWNDPKGALGRIFSLEHAGGIARDAAMLGAGLAGPRMMGKIPGARIVTAAGEGVKAGAAKLPIIGPPMKAAANAARKSWSETAPPKPVVPPAAKAAPSTPTAKPKLSAQEAAAYLRQEFGSEQAGRMLYGKGRDLNLIPSAERTAAIKRLAPGESHLPKSAERAIDTGIQKGSAEEAWRYATKAPNDLAREYLIRLMRGGK